MANALYNTGRQAFLEGDIDWLDDTIKAVLVDTADYTPDLVNHDFLDDVSSAARVATSAALSGKSADNGVADAADVVFSSVSGDQAEALILYKDTGTETTSPLIAYLDSAAGLPVSPDGSDITVQWDNGANKIFKL